VLRSREEARQLAVRLVEGVVRGAGGSLLLTGEAGSGKSTLLADVVRRAGAARVVQTVGAPVERGVPHAGLHALLRPFEVTGTGLPRTQRRALDVALGRDTGPAPTPLLLGAATTSLLAASAERRPLLLVVDDAQWVDEASLQALAFAGRRLAGEPVGLLVAARSDGVPPCLHDLPACGLGPVTASEAEVLLAPAGVAASVVAELLAATGGNVLALAEAVQRMTADQRSGRAPLPEALPPGRLFSAAVQALPAAALDAVALTALLSDASAPVLARAWTSQGVSAADLRPAEDAGLLVIGGQGVTWRHPLARAAVLAGLAPRQRRELAATAADAALEAGASQDLVVELRLAAAEGPDERLALALERRAVSAGGAGDHVRAARGWTRAAATGTSSVRRPVRLLEAAESTLRAGRLPHARLGYAEALDAGLEPSDEARARLALGRIQHLAGSPRLALEEFRRSAAASSSSAERVRACAEGVLAAMYAGRPDEAQALAAEAEAAHDRSCAVERVLALHSRGAASCLSGDTAAGGLLLRAAVHEARRWQVLDAHPDLVLWVVNAPLFDASPPDAGAELAGPALEQLRLRGDLLWLPRVVRLWGVRHELAGRVPAAFATYEEAVELSRAAGQTTQLVEALGQLAGLEALRGDRDQCLAHVDEVSRLLVALDVPFLTSTAWRAEGLLHLGLGATGRAVTALAGATELPTSLRWRADTVADLVEALLREGRRAEAGDVAARVPSDRASALLETDDGRAVELFLAAAAAAGSDVVQAARCHLLAGERLRRAGRRREARTHLRTAEEAFARVAATPWRQRAQEALRASGETLTSPSAHSEPLTGAELRVAALVAEGRPTREVAALLFLSPKTVEFHLSRIYRKLGVRGRTELARAAAGHAT
jgi:DNA-binding CsgD family transcriptional regulator